MIDDSVDWAEVPNHFKHLRRDKVGEAFFYTDRPGITNDYWFSKLPSVNAKNFSSYSVGTKPWNLMILDRPDWI